MPEKGLLSQTSKKSKDFVVGHLPNKEPTTKERKNEPFPGIPTSRHSGPSWTILGPSWDHFELPLKPSRDHLRLSWTMVGPSWDHLAIILANRGPSWAILDHLGPIWPKKPSKRGAGVGPILHPKCIKTCRIRKINKISENIFDTNRLTRDVHKMYENV